MARSRGWIDLPPCGNDDGGRIGSERRILVAWHARWRATPPPVPRTVSRAGGSDASWGQTCRPDRIAPPPAEGKERTRDGTETRANRRGEGRGRDGRPDRLLTGPGGPGGDRLREGPDPVRTRGDLAVRFSGKGGAQSDQDRRCTGGGRKFAGALRVPVLPAPLRQGPRAGEGDGAPPQGAPRHRAPWTSRSTAPAWWMPASRNSPR